MTDIKWFRVSRKRPCAICHKFDWCTYSEIGSSCMRIASAHFMHNGGWLHKSDDSAAATREKLMLPMPPPRAPIINSAAIMQRLAGATTYQNRVDYAASLGVDPMAVDVLGASWSPEHDAWAWPMVDGAGSVCGIRLRSDTAKWAVKGSKSGLFIPNFEPFKGIDTMICEGPTDTAAALTMGFYAIGRPQCRGFVDMLRETCQRLRIFRVIIVADNDSAKVRPDGSKFWPGQEGARQLAKELKIPCIIITPNAKDIRSWLKDGATRDDVDYLIKQQIFKKGG